MPFGLTELMKMTPEQQLVWSHKMALEYAPPDVSQPFSGRAPQPSVEPQQQTPFANLLPK